MKPVRRKIRRHFGLTAKQVAVRSHRPWYFQWVVALVFVLSGYFLGYWQYGHGRENFAEKLQQATLENQNLQTKVIRLERQLQIEQIAQSNLEKELNSVQDENIKIKEDLLFYKSMVRSKKLTR